MGFNPAVKGLMRQSFVLQQWTVAVDMLAYGSVPLVAENWERMLK